LIVLVVVKAIASSSNKRCKYFLIAFSFNSKINELKINQVVINMSYISVKHNILFKFFKSKTFNKLATKSVC